MACYKHEAEEPVATCPCGRSLCRSCSERFDPVTCEKCAVESVRSLRRGIYGDFAITAALFGLGLVMAENTGQRTGAWLGLIIGYVYAGTRAGWIALGNIGSPRSTLAIPIVFWLGFQFLKLLLAVVVGIVALPIRLSRQLLALIRTGSFERQIQSQEFSGPRLVYSAP